MKRIMKKALSLVLALVMMLTLAPMTAKAATTPLSNNVQVTAEYVAGGDWVVYEYTANAAGTLKLTIDSVECEGVPICDVEFGTAGGRVVQGQEISYSVQAGVTYTIRVYEAYETSNATIKFTTSFEEGAAIPGQTFDEAVEANVNPYQGYATVTAYANTETYYFVTGYHGDYTLTVDGGRPAGNTYFNVYSYDGTGEVTDDGSGFGGASVSATGYYNAGVIFFSIVNTGSNNLDVMVSITEGAEEKPLGSEENKDNLDVNTGSFEYIELTSDLNIYYYTWTADQEGYLTIEMAGSGLNSDGWVYSISEEYGRFDALYSESTYSDEERVDTAVVGVKEGEVVNIWFAATDYEPGTVYYKATFEADEVNRQENVVEFEDITKYDEVLEMEDLVYTLYVREDITGTQTVPVNHDTYMPVPTLYSFIPEELGVYTIKTSSGKIGYYGPNTNVLTDPTNTTDVVEVTVESYGGIVIGVTDTDESEITLTVTKKGSVQEKPSSTTYEEAKYDKEPAKYTFTGNVELLTYIEVEDDVVDKAVLGSDGYYHLNSVDGPILLVKLDGQYGTANPIVTAKNNALKGFDANGKAWDYSKLYTFYTTVADKDTMLYPLNDDLIEIYKSAGKEQGWYTKSLGGVETEDAWMFNCYYIPNSVKVEVPADKVLTEDALEDAIKEAVDNNLPLVVETTTEGVTLTFAVEDLKDAETVKLNVEVKLDVDVKDETVAKNDKITKDNFVLKVEFSHDGKLPAKATITIPVPVAYAGKTLYYYQILEDGTLKFVCDAPVDANGNAKVTQDHCSDYVLLTEKVAVEAPGTGDSANFALWIAVLGLGVVAMAGSVVMKKREF